MDIEVRKAISEDDRSAVYNLRYELYVARQGLFQDTADHQNRHLYDHLDREATLFMAMLGDQLIGSSRLVWGSSNCFDHELRETFDIESFTDIIGEHEMSVGSRFLVVPEHRQSPVPALLFKAMTEELVERETEVMFGECEPHLINTWARLGVRPFGIVEHPINGTLIRVALVIGDVDYAYSVDSPLTPILAKRTKQNYTPRRLAARLGRNHQVISQGKDSSRFWAKVEETIAIDRLAQLLGDLTPPEFDALLANSVAIDCDPNSMLIRKGHVSRTLYILLSGTLEVWDGDRHITTVDRSGEVLGEVAFFSKAKRMSDVKAGGEGAQVLALSDRSLQQLIGTQGSGAAKFLFTIARSLCGKLHERANS